MSIEQGVQRCVDTALPTDRFMKVCKTSSPCLRVHSFARSWWRYNLASPLTDCNTHYIKHGATQIPCNYVDSYLLALVDRNSKLTSLPHPPVFLSVLGLLARSVVLESENTVSHFRVEGNFRRSERLISNSIVSGHSTFWVSEN